MKVEELEALAEKATKGPWWKWPDMPYLFSGNKEQKNAYMAEDTVRVCRIDYTESDAEFILALANHRQEIINLVKAAKDVITVSTVTQWESDIEALSQALAAFEDKS